MHRMEDLELYPLCLVLSYLSETEGTSLLITRKKFASRILPLFRVRDDAFAGLSVVGKSKAKRRHRFVVSPVQDSSILLERLNTKRLYQRKKRLLPGKTTSDIAREEWAAAVSCGGLTAEEYPACLGTLRFLTTQDDNLRKHTGTLLVSYPRSGNTLMRTLLERVTGVVTGSDTRPDRSLSRELAEQHGMVGEGITQTSKVLFLKTHWPERTGCRQYEGKRAVLLVRNVYDAIDSYWNLNATKTHTRTVTDAVYERFADKYERLVRSEIKVWLDFHEYWLKKSSIPVLIVRFEDLVQDPSVQLRRVLQFSFNEKKLSALWERRIAYVTSESPAEGLGSYRPRSSQSKVLGKSLHKGRYSDELLSFIEEMSSNAPNDYIRLFGYSRSEEGFPHELPPLQLEHSMPCRTQKKAQLKVNLGKPVRPCDCEFGRAMQQWRHSVTNGDCDPLPTASTGR